MPQPPYISKITLPSGNTYTIKDAWARERIESLTSGALTYIGITTTQLEDGSTTHPITIGGESKEPTNGNVVVVNVPGGVSKEFVWTETTPGDISTGMWLEFGDLSTLGQLAYQNVVSIEKGSGKNVLGADAEFKVDVPIYDTETTNIKATASGTEISGDVSASAITGLGTPSTDTFVKSVQAVTGKKLVTTTLQGVKGTAKTAQRVTATTKKLVTTEIKGVSGTESVLQQVTASKSHLGIQNISQITGNTDVTVQNVSNVGTASTWNFAMGNGAEFETLIISGTNSTTPTLDAAQTASKVTNSDVQVATGNLVNDGNGAEVATDVNKTYAEVATADSQNTTVATGSLGTTGGDDIVESVTMTEVTNLAELGETKTLATGSTDTNGEGDSIVSDVQVGESAAAITSITPETKMFLQSVKVLQQPTISLSTGATSGTGVIQIVTGVSSSSNLQNVSVTNQDVTKVALYDDLDVTVS